MVDANAETIALGGLPTSTYLVGLVTSHEGVCAQLPVAGGVSCQRVRGAVPWPDLPAEHVLAPTVSP